MKLLEGAGFTIIELMLFLAISGLMFVGILASTGGSVNVQRYKDSVTSLQSYFQKQYSGVINTNNDVSTNDCGTSVDVSRGQSDCVILGKLITSSNNGESLLVRRIIGVDNDLYNPGNDDVTIFNTFSPSILTATGSKNDLIQETYPLEWGAVLKTDVASGKNTSRFSILILRSPVSGAIRTFIDSSMEVTNNAQLRAMISATYSVNQLKTCVDGNGLYDGPKSAVIIHANAASQSDVEVVGDKDSGC